MQIYCEFHIGNEFYENFKLQTLKQFCNKFDTNGKGIRSKSDTNLKLILKEIETNMKQIWNKHEVNLKQIEKKHENWSKLKIKIR